MLLPIHIVIALSSLVATALGALVPSQVKLRISYGLIVLTLASGTLLTITRSVHLLQVCTTGLIYLGVVLTGVAATRYRLKLTDNRE